jgi:DMSO/TMAO reductase YedYZ molybdopterin-dependent catalytic subunit
LIFISLLLAGVTAVVIGLGFAWSWRLGPEQLWLRQTAISWHWMLALGLLFPFVLHVWRRWPRPKKADLLSRRAALKLVGLGAASIAGWWSAGWLAAGREELESPRRHTGSRRAGAFTGNRFPVTHSRAAGEMDLGTYRLVINGAVTERLSLAYAELSAFPVSELAATLDCTLGWYTVQNWRGIRLEDLVDRAGGLQRSFAVRLESVTGYAHILPIDEARQILLATHVGDEVLEHLHGFPLRAVVPTRRGWFWVKWVNRIEVISL